jgi:hypothetical protein
MFTHLVTKEDRKAIRAREATKFDQLRLELVERYEDPAYLFRAMLFYFSAKPTVKSPYGCACFCFRDLFGFEPEWKHRQGGMHHLPDPDFQHWMDIRDRINKRKWPSVRAKLIKEGKYRGEKAA